MDNTLSYLINPLESFFLETNYTCIDTKYMTFLSSHMGMDKMAWPKTTLIRLTDVTFNKINLIAPSPPAKLIEFIMVRNYYYR